MDDTSARPTPPVDDPDDSPGGRGDVAPPGGPDQDPGQQPEPAAPGAEAAAGAGEPASERTRVRREPERASYDRDAVHAVLDAALVAHVGFVERGEPVVVPLTYARVGDDLLLHASVAGRAGRALRAGTPVCVSVTVVDGLVLARSLFNHSMNYRSVIVYGVPTDVGDLASRRAGLEALADGLFPGRSSECRPMTDAEVRQTVLVRVSLAEASVKVRTGGPGDPPEDAALPIWAGELPVERRWGEPRPAGDLPDGVEAGPSVAAVRRRPPP